MTEFAIVDTVERPYLYVTRRSAMASETVSAAMGEAFHQVMAFIREKGVSSADAALSVYYRFDPQEMEFRAGFFVSPEDAAKAEGEIGADVTPACRAVSFTHFGPYAELQDSYDRMMDWMAREGLTMSAPAWEVYLNGPDDTPEDELRTDVFVALA